MGIMCAAYLHARLVERHAEAVCVLAVVLHELLQGAEGGAPGDEETALIQLSDAVMLHRISVSHCEQSYYSLICILLQFKLRKIGV